MKKNVLALSITAALVGFAGGAQAVGLVANVAPSGATATVLQKSPDGTGHFLYVPYYSVQAGNHTMINIVNTDTVNGKAVKVRFRGAANSDDLFDFQVFLSPGDVWTADVSKNAAGLALLNTADKSCTKPAKSTVAGDHGINDEPFHTQRMNSFRSGDLLANETREGYVEIFNMADIPSNASTASLFYAIKHKNSVPPCSGTAWTALDTDLTTNAAAVTAGFAPPTTGLFANWIILNATDAGAWSGEATAIEAATALGAPSTGNIVYFPQTNEAIATTSAAINLFTSDPFLLAHPTYAAAYDLPDFSTPYLASSTTSQQVAALNATLATASITNEFLTSSSINATTDWVLSMPTRRYAVSWDYFASTPARIYTPSAYFDATNTTVIDKQICVTGTTSTSYDQEENTPLNPGSSVIISPVLPGLPSVFLICGESSVLAFNHGETASSTNLITSASGSLKATVARSAIENGYAAGWTRLSTPGLSSLGLPILGYEAVRATGAANAQGFFYTFGATLPHRTQLVNR